MIDQKKLNTSCIPYTVKAERFDFPDVRTRYEAIPIRMYKTVHATGNNHPGGESIGLFNAWKASILFRVKRADRPPNASGSAIHKINFFHCIFKISPLLNQYMILVIPIYIKLWKNSEDYMILFGIEWWELFVREQQYVFYKKTVEPGSNLIFSHSLSAIAFPSPNKWELQVTIQPAFVETVRFYLISNSL